MILRLIPRFLFEEAGDKGGAGGTGTPPAGDKGAPPPDSGKEISDLKASNAALLARLEKLEGKGAPPPAGDDDLRARAIKEREASDRSSGDIKALEAALRFNMDAPNFLKNNANLLPKDINDIFVTAEKENYGSAKEKADAIKSAVVQSFFALQANIDLLTPGLKSQLEDYLKLTKTGKQEKATQIYDSIFEPAFDTLKRVKKAEALSKGHGTGGASDDAYKSKMIALSKKHYLGEKV